MEPSASLESLKEKFPETTDCHVLAKQIEELRNLRSYFVSKLNNRDSKAVNKYLEPKEAYFFAAGCNVTVQDKLYKSGSEILEKEAQAAQKEVEAASKLQRNKLIFISAGTLIIALAVLIINTKKKK